MKKIFAFVLVLFVALSVISCGEEDTTHSIIFYHTMGDSLQSVLKVAKDDFERKFPGWTVKDSAIGGYDDVKSAVIADLQGKTQPGLVYCYADHVAQYLQTQKVVDMSKFINSTDEIEVAKSVVAVDEQGDLILDNDGNPTYTTENAKELVGYTEEEINDFVRGYYLEGLATNYADYEKYGYTDTSMLTLPFVKSTELMYYNKTALTAAGIDKAPETWDELWVAAEKVKEVYPNCIPVGYDSEANWFITMAEQNGWGYTSAKAPHYVFNTPQANAWLSTLKDKYLDGILTTQNAYGSYTSNLFVKGAPEGGVVFSIGSSGGASHQKPKDGLFEWDIAPVPGSVVNNEVVHKAISQGPSLCMLYEEVDNQDEKALMTWEFVKMLLEPKFQAQFSIASGYNPARESTYEIEDYITHLEGSDITAVAAKVAKTMTDSFFTSPAFVGSSTARTQVGNVVVYALTGEKSAEKALVDAMKNCGAK